jgi:hypothetical protein
MENSQLVYLLTALGKGELRELRKWLLSPIHNQREDVVKLFDYLTEKERLSDEKKLAKAIVFKKLFPGEPFDDARLRQAVYFLQKCTEDYLAYREFQQDEIRSALALAEVFRRKNLDRLLEKTLKKLQEDQKNGQLRDEAYLQNQYLLEAIEYQYISEKKRTPDTNLQAYSDTLDLRFIAGKLRLASLITAVQRVYKQDIRIGLLEETLNAVEKNGMMGHPAISVYYYIYRALSDSTREEYFFSLKEAIFQHDHCFSLEEQRDILLLAVNYCIAKMNTGAATFVGEAFDLYKRGIENGALLDKGVLNHLTFINIVTTGTTLRQFDWVRWFIQNFQQYLAPQYRENFVCFSLAKLHFEQREYPQAQRLLMQFDYDDILFNLSAKSMLIKIYFEESEYSALDSLLESLRTYINRKKAIAYHKNIYNNLIRFTKRLVRISPYDKAQKEKLRQDIEAANPLPERKWLLEQLDNL